MLEQRQCQRAQHYGPKRGKREGLTLEPVRERAEYDYRPEIQHNEDCLGGVDVEAEGALALGAIDLHPGHDGLGQLAFSKIGAAIRAAVVHGA